MKYQNFLLSHITTSSYRSLHLHVFNTLTKGSVEFFTDQIPCQSSADSSGSREPRQVFLLPRHIDSPMHTELCSVFEYLDPSAACQIKSPTS